MIAAVNAADTIGVFGILLFVGGVILAIVWLIFPFLVVSRLGSVVEELQWSREQLTKANAILRDTLNQAEHHATRDQLEELKSKIAEIQTTSASRIGTLLSEFHEAREQLAQMQCAFTEVAASAAQMERLMQWQAEQQAAAPNESASLPNQPAQ